MKYSNSLLLSDSLCQQVPTGSHILDNMTIKLMILACFMAVAGAQRFIKPMENPDLYHGDIAGEQDTRNRNAVTTRSRRWPNGIIPYSIDSGMFMTVPIIRRAFQHLEATTCIKFEPFDGTQNGYIRIFPGDGCYSYWGRTGGQQPISLGRGCENFGIVLHELCHAIGFDHEQNRSDRDEYVTIFWNNIEAGAEAQFKKNWPSNNWLINAFDFNSIMIYGETAFSRDGYSKTMVAKKRGVTFTGPDRKSGLSPSDIQRIHKLYECR